MEVKIQCPCGTRFSFDVEPVNGYMPVRVNCPQCGADGTDLANDFLRQHFSVATPPATPVPPPAPGAQPLRIAGTQPQPAAAAAPTEPATTACARHARNVAVENCRVCGKPMCSECMEQFGYVCSVACRTQAEKAHLQLPVFKKQRAVVQARWDRIGAWVWRIAALLIITLAAGWIWYIFVASRPHVAYSAKIPQGDEGRYYQFLGPDQMLVIQASQMTLFDVSEKKPLWSVPLSSAGSPGVVTTDSNEDETFQPGVRVVATANDLWILFPGRLDQFDRRTGNRKQEISLNPPFFGLSESDAGLTAISADDSGHEVVTRVAFADGSVHTEPLAEPITPLNTPATPASPMKPPPGSVATAEGKELVAAAVKATGAKTAKPVVLASQGDRFVPDGADVMQMKVALLERRVITHEAMKAPQQSLVNNNLTAGQSLDASEQMINEMRREQTGGVEQEDVSRYQVTLRRWPGGGSTDWTGEVTGPPSFFAFKTVNVLVAGSSIHVFDKNNQELWKASLTYSIAPRLSADFATEAEPPGVEAGGCLYLFDKGTLTSFNVATGDVHWRLTSVGISQVLPDGKGNLYVASTTASPDSIQFSQQISFSAHVNPLILKVEAATGRILWRSENLGARCYLSGKFLYASRSAVDQVSVLTPGEDPVYYFDMYRLNPPDGRVLWDYSQSRHPLQIDVQGNEILLHFPGELQILKFLSL